MGVYDETVNLSLEKLDIDEVDELDEDEVMVVIVDVVEMVDLEYADIEDEVEVDIISENTALDNDKTDDETEIDVMLHDVEVDEEVEMDEQVEVDDEVLLKSATNQTEVVDSVQLHDELKHYVIDIAYTHSQVMVHLLFLFSFNS